MIEHIRANKWMVIITCLVSLGGILYGYDIGVISGALLFIKNTIPMSDAQVGLLVSAVLGGGLIGTLVAGPLGDRYGRRFLIMLSSLIFIVGVSIILGAHVFLTLWLARLLLGIGVGVVAVAVPLYVAEIVPAKDRGKYVTAFQLLLTFGIMSAYIVDLLFTPTGNWRAMFAVVLIPAVILLIGMFWLPETPRWLIANHQIDRARLVLRRLRFNAVEMEHHIQSIQLGLHETQGSFRELFSKHAWLPTLAAMLIAIFNQLTGINSFLQYAPLILKEAGVYSNFVTMIGSVGIGLLNFVSTLVAIAFIDTLGRRPLLLMGVMGVVISECWLGSLPLWQLSPAWLGVFSLMGLLLFITSFAIGPGVVVWLVISELFPTRVRGKGVSLCLFFNSLTATILTTFFLPMFHKLGVSQTYWLFAAFSMCYFVLAYYLLPETKTKTLEEIQAIG